MKRTHLLATAYIMFNVGSAQYMIIRQGVCVQTKLIENLTINKVYCTSFYYKCSFCNVIKTNYDILPPSSFIRHDGIWHGLPNNTLTIYLLYIISLMIINL